MLAEGECEQIVIGQHLSEANVVRDECGDDADSTTSLANACVTLEVSYSYAKRGR